MPLDEDLKYYRLAADLAGLAIDDFGSPASHHHVVYGLRLHHLDWGRRGQPPVLFLHGGGLNAHTWDLVCLALRDRYHCLALDQRGHGDSEWSPEADYRLASQVADLEGFVDVLGLESFHLVGHSMGALTGFAYAKRHAARLRTLTLVDVGPTPREANVARVVDFILRTSEVASVEAFIDEARRFNPIRDPRLLQHSAHRNLRRRPDGRYMRKNDIRYLQQSNASQLADDFARTWTELELVTCPVLLVRGALSGALPDDASAQRFADAFPDAQWVRIENAGHTVQGDNPRDLSEALVSFLARF